MLHQIGVGALGPVFRTYEPTRDRLVAIKVFRLDITPEQAQALADELSKPAEAGLFHPSIVEPIASGVEGTVAYRAEEYVAAETLDVAMRHYAPATVEKVLPFITQLAGAIDFARSAGVGHGALHPRDIFVTPEEARASGFGVVEALERVGLRAPVRRPYTAPERVAGGGWGAPADVFSLAVIAYELLTGRRPSGTGAEIGPIDASPHAAGIQAVLIQAMDEDPSRRHASALAFASALDAASRAEPAAAPKAAVIPQPVAPVVPQEEAFDDVAGERDEDEANAALALDEARAEELGALAGRDGSFFDDEAIEDLALEREALDEPQRFSEDFAIAPQRLDEPVAKPAPGRRLEADREREEEEDQEPAPVFGTAPPLGSYREDPLVIHDRAGLPLVPVIVTVALALLVGFAAGYALGRRVDSATPADTVAQTTPPTGAAPGEPGSAKPFSEQAVTPPAAAQPTGDPAAAPPASAPEASAPKPSGEAAAAPGATPATPKPEPPVTTPAPVATTGRIEVRSTPSGAGVTVDGVWRGRTPLTLDKLRFKEYAVRIVQPGYAAAREEVSLSSAAPSRSVSVKLQRSAATVATPRPARPAPSAPAKPEVYTGSIYVDSRPRGARVLVDGKFMGTTPVRIADMSIGSHVVRLQLADHRDWTTSTRVTAGEEARVTGSLERNR